MKKIIVVLCLLVGMAGAVSAQKKEMLAQHALSWRQAYMPTTVLCSMTF